MPTPVQFGGQRTGRIAGPHETVELFNVDSAGVAADSGSPSGSSIETLLAADVASALTSHLNCLVSVAPQPRTVIKAEEVQAIPPTAGILFGLSLGPRGAPGWVFLERSVAFPCLEMLLGGKETLAIIPERQPTDIERRLLKTILPGVVERTLKLLGQPLVFALEETPRVPLGGSGVPLVFVCLNFEVGLGQSAGQLRLVLPRDLLGANASLAAEPTLDQPDTRRSMLEAFLRNTRINVTAQLDGIMVRTTDILGLQAGDLLVTDYSDQTMVQLAINGIPKFQAKLAEMNGTRTFKIVGV